MCLLIIGAAAAALLTGCPEEPAEQPEDNNKPIIKKPPTGDQASWESEIIEGGGFGTKGLDLAIVSGQPAVAYFAANGQPLGPCTQVMSDTPPEQISWPLRYGVRGVDGSWQLEDVAAPLYVGTPPGLDLAVDPGSGQPVLAMMVGEPLPDLLFCGANDVALLRRDGPSSWSTDVAVRTSGEAATGEAGSDFGDVVGYWPSLAFDASGDAWLAYQDVHSGSIMADDLRRADLELARNQGGGWSTTAVDIGRGAGRGTTALVGEDGTAWLVYVNPTEIAGGERRGIWVARSTDDAATWEMIRISGAAAEAPAALLDDEGRLRVLLYDEDRGYPRLATLDDASAFADISAGWSFVDLGNGRFDEGYAPSLALAGDGRLAAAWYRCATATVGLGNCQAADDALIVALQDDEGAFSSEVVDEGGPDGLCGRAPVVAFDAQSRAVVAYHCEVAGAEQGLEDAVKFAWRSE